jgi:ATP adenylyltransferase
MPIAEWPMGIRSRHRVFGIRHSAFLIQHFMNHLWSPWRLSYVTGTGTSTGCVFCDAQSGAQASLIVFHGRTCFVILNKFPYNNGHLMVVPNRHIPSLAAATEEELCELIELTRRSEIALGEAYSPHGMNMGINIGKPAGAGVLDHVHLHVVPRWNGDTNYMTVVGETRVLPEELPQAAEKLRPIFERLQTLFHEGGRR